MFFHPFHCRLSNSLSEFDILHLGDSLDSFPLFGREVYVYSDVFHHSIIHQFIGSLPNNLRKSLDMVDQPRYDEGMSNPFGWYAKFRKLVVSE